MPHRNVFLAHPSGMDDAVLAALRDEVKAAMEPLLEPGMTITVTTGKEDHTSRFGMCGGWPGWIQSVAEGTVTGLEGVRHLFDAYVVAPSETMGKATAEIIDRALTRGKAVFLYRGGIFRAGRTVVEIDRRDLRGGWVLEA